MSMPCFQNADSSRQVVYVVLESQYQSSMTVACKRINAGQENICVEAVGYLLEELRNPNTLAAFKKVDSRPGPAHIGPIWLQYAGVVPHGKGPVGGGGFTL